MHVTMTCNDECHNNDWWYGDSRNAAMLSVVMLNVTMTCYDVCQNEILCCMSKWHVMMNVTVMIVDMVIVVMVNAVMLNVVAPNLIEIKNKKKWNKMSCFWPEVERLEPPFVNV